MFDVSTLPFEENVRQTKAAVEALKTIRPEILVEGEIGNIGSGSEIHDAAPDLKSLTTPAQAKQFVEETEVDTSAVWDLNFRAPPRRARTLILTCGS